MKKLISLIILIVLFSCIRDISTEFVESPSKKFYINATVNRTNRDSDVYAEVIIHLYNSRKLKIDSIITGVGDFNKWTLKWDSKSDIIILENSDVGDKFYKIESDRILVIKK